MMEEVGTPPPQINRNNRFVIEHFYARGGVEGFIHPPGKIKGG